MHALRAQIKITPVTHADLAEIAVVRMDSLEGAIDSFESYIYPPALRPPLEARLGHSTAYLTEALDSRKYVMIKASLVDTGKIVGFAQWILPGGKEQEPESPDGERAEREGLDLVFWNKLFGEMQMKCERVMGDRPFWHLVLLTVAPAHHNAGIGRALVEWGISRADTDGVDVYVEASISGRRLYEKTGFNVVDWCELEIEEKNVKWPCMLRKGAGTHKF